MNVGMPVMKLDRQAHKQGERAGNARAVCLEAMEERAGIDPDIDREKSKDNIYYGDFRSGKELADWYEQMAADYVITDKNGKQKRLRSDAGIAFTGIIKPVRDDFGKLSEKQRIRFLEDSLEIVRDIYGSRGMEIDAAVIHVDEGNQHLHYFGHDPEYKTGKKLGLPLFDALNREYPERMRQKGWQVDSLTGWKEETAGMTKEEKEDYMAKRRKKQHGKTSAEYKAERRLKELEAKNAELEAETEGFAFKPIYKKAEKRRDKAEADAKAAEARQKAAEAKLAEVKALQAEAERKAQEAAQKAQDAREAEEKARDALKDLKAQAGDIRRSVSDAVSDAERVRDYMDKISRTPLRASDAAIIKYLKANKQDGKSLYEVFQERATVAQRRAAGTHSTKIGSVVKAARNRVLPDIQIPQQSDDEFSM